MPAPLILARTFKEAHAYAQGELGLTIGHYRVVNSVGTIKAVRNTELHLVPGWNKRPGHFAFKSALRYVRLTVIDVEKVRESAAALDAVAPAPVDEGSDPRGPLTERQYATAYRYNSLRDETRERLFAQEPEPAAAVTPEPEPAPEAPKGKRRTRCKTCGTLHFKTEPCPPEAD